MDRGRRRSRTAAGMAALAAVGAAMGLPAGARAAEDERATASARPATDQRATASAALRVRIVDRSQQRLLRTGRLRVRVSGDRGARVSLTATAVTAAASSSGRRSVHLARARRVRLASTRARTVTLTLSASGRTVAGSCRTTRLSVRARAAQATRRRRGRAGPPAFTGATRTRTATATLRRDRERCGPIGEPTSVRAGTASIDITPPIGTPMFAYTARSGVVPPGSLITGPQIALQLIADPDSGMYAKTFVPSEGIHTRVRARAMVLESPSGKVALVQADLGGVPFAMIQEVARRVAARGFGPERILVSATHTHASTGPIWPNDSQGYALLGGDLFDPRIFELTTQGIADAIVAADSRLAPARVGVATAELRTASRNRGEDAFVRNADVPRDEAARKLALINPDLTVIRADAADGRPLGAWSNFAIHPTSFGDENAFFSGDNAGYAERIAETTIQQEGVDRGFGAREDRPVVNVWTNGAEGDVSPNGGADRVGEENLQYTANSYTGAHLAGGRVGAGIVAAWRTAGRDLRGTLELGARRTFVSFDGTTADGEPVGPVPVLGNGGIGLPDGTCAPVDNFSGPGQGRKFPLIAGQGLVPQTHPVSVVRVGSLGIAAFPAEITKQMGVRIANALQQGSGGAFGRVVIAGLTNGYASYTATPEEYDACQYEGSFTLWGRRQGPRFLAAARNALTSLLGGPAAGGAPEPPPPGFPPSAGGSGNATPSAGAVVAEPPAAVARFGAVTFRWRGGHPSVDAPRNRTFVALQRETPSGRWTTVATDDSYYDTTAHASDDTWTERFQFDECSPLGTHRFLVTGVANRGSGPAPYQVTSRTFEVGPVSGIKAGPLTVQDGRARVSATYPDPGRDILLALPRRVRTGVAVLEVRDAQGRTTRVLAPPDADGLTFSAPVPAGATATLVEVRDACGNRGA